MRLEGFMATKSFMILGKSYQSDFSHTDPACQFQQQWTKWWWDRFTLDYSDVREHVAWMIYEQWCLLVRGLWSRFQRNSLYSRWVLLSELSEHWKTLHWRTSWVCWSVFAASVWCIRLFRCFQKCLLKCFK